MIFFKKNERTIVRHICFKVFFVENVKMETIFKKTYLGQ